MRINIKNLKRIILQSPGGQTSYLYLTLRDNSRYLFKFDNYVTSYGYLKELKAQLRKYVNSTRIGYLFCNTAKYTILQLIDSDNEADYISAQLYLKDRIKLDGAWDKNDNKNFSLECMLAVSEKNKFNNAPIIYFNIS